jgi:uncharacterized protein (TIGR00266 family)
MAFCTNCGTQVKDDARFCANCGSAMGAAASNLPGTYVPPPPPEPLKYDIEGHNLQVARVHLQPGQEIFAEAGKMVYKTSNVSWETRMSGNSLGQKLLGAIKRRLMGESIMMTYFRTQLAGEVGFAGHYPGKIHVFDLAHGQSIMVQRDGFLFAQSSVQLDIALVRKLGTGLLGGEGFILEKLTGPGEVFVHAGGDFVQFDLAAGEQIQVQTGHLVAFDPSVDYDIQMVGSIRTAIFGGEGIFLATLTGPGKVVLQSLTLERLRHELAPAAHGGDEHRPLGALGGGVGGVVGGLGSIFGSDD